MTSIVTPPPLEADTLTAPMPYRPLGRTGWNASLLTLGGVKWDSRLNDACAAALVRRALELGVNTFDTAHSYSNGESERKLGLALEGVRDRVFLSTKTLDRTYDGAMREIEISLKRLRTDRIDLLFVHSLDNEEQYRRIMAPDSVLKALEAHREAGSIRFIGVSGHWVKHVMARIIGEYPFDAALFPAGLFNIAYGYSFVDSVLPLARAREMAVLGMKVYGAGRIKHARSVEPYLRYTLNQPLDTAVIGSDSIEQLEQTIRLVKRGLPPLRPEEQAALLPEAREITQAWDDGEFSWVRHYTTHG